MKPLHNILVNLAHDGNIRPDIKLDDLRLGDVHSQTVFEEFPFCSKKAEHFDRLEDEIQMYIDWAVLTAAEEEQRMAFLKELQRLVDEIATGYKAFMFGSQAAQTASYFSDIDVCISNFPEQYRERLVDALQTIAPGANYISQAKVPIIQGIYSSCNIDFDISFEHSINTDRDIIVEKQLTPPLRALLIIMKAYLRERSMHTPHIGGLSGHLLIELILALAQNRGKYFKYRPSSRWPNATALLEFLEFYGSMFNYDNLYIYRTSNGRYSFERRGNQIYRDKVKNHGIRPILCIISGDRDIAGGVYNYNKIAESFDCSYLVLLQKRNAAVSILGSVLSIDRIGLSTRKIIEQINSVASAHVFDVQDTSSSSDLIDEV